MRNPEHKRARNNSFASLSGLNTVTSFIQVVRKSKATDSNQLGSWQQGEKQHLRDHHNAGNLQQ